MRNLLVTFLLLTIAGGVHAQVPGGLPGQDSPFVRLARPGESTKKVVVVTDVGGGGVYLVGETISLDPLLVMTGAVATAPDVPDQRQEVTISLYRRAGGQRTLIYEAPLEQVLDNPEEHPTLQDDDVVKVDVTVHRKRFSWQQTFTIINTLGTLTILVLRIASIW